MSKSTQTYKYKNVSGRTQVLIGFGIVKANDIITTNTPVSNPNFEAVVEKTEPKPTVKKGTKEL